MCHAYLLFTAHFRDKPHLVRALSSNGAKIESDFESEEGSADFLRMLF